MKSLKIGLLLALVAACSPAYSGVKLLEKHYQEAWCSSREDIVAIEYRLSDGTRVDCMLEDYALEVDWARNWAEAIGQSLYYAIKTNKKAAVLLIVGPDEERFLDRLNEVAEKYEITVFVVPKV